PRFSRSPRYSLPDHLSRFGVRAAESSLEAFLGSIGSPCFPRMRSLSSLRHYEGPFSSPRPTLLDVDYHRHAEATFLRHPIANLLPVRFTRSARRVRRPTALQA